MQQLQQVEEALTGNLEGGGVSLSGGLKVEGRRRTWGASAPLFLSPAPGASILDQVEVIREAFRGAHDLLGRNLPGQEPLPAWEVVNALLAAHALDTAAASEATTALRRFGFPAAGWKSHGPVVQAAWDMIRQIDRTKLLSAYPYVVDPFGPGSRRHVMTDRKHLVARLEKKATGSFYTPGDVVHFVARQTLLRNGPVEPNHLFLDPACGTGVFLLEMSHQISKATQASPMEAFERHLCGFDINELALASCTFALLVGLAQSECKNGQTPAALLSRIRARLCNVDSIRVAGPLNRQGAAPSAEERRALGYLSAGVRGIIGNPPYTKLEAHGNSDAVPLFARMTWTLCTGAAHSSGLVLPLSVGFSSLRPYADLRREMRSQGGQLTFLSFDRTPDSLFGDDVKTRNLIFFRAGSTSTSEIATVEASQLIRWTSRTRPSLFEKISTVSLGPMPEGPIPKLGTRWEAGLWKQFPKPPKTRPYWVADGHDPHSDTTILVARTAYNYLGVKFADRRAVEELETTLNTPWKLSFPSTLAAKAAFGLLSSRLAYWWWRVTGDGFHVSRSFLESLPFERVLIEPGASELARSAVRLWKVIQDCPTISVNRAKTTISYSPFRAATEQDEIDQVVAELLTVSKSNLPLLKSFVRENAVVDGTDSSRWQKVGLHDEGVGITA